MSYDTIITLDKKFHRIIDEGNVAYLDLVVYSKYRRRVNKVTSETDYRTGYADQEYDRRLKVYGIDKSENVQKSLWNIVRNTHEIFREEPWPSLLRQEKKCVFLARDSFIPEIVKRVKKSADKLAAISKALKILNMLQYCTREDLENELKTCFSFFMRQLKGRTKQPVLASKTMAEVLKVFCVAEFMKRIILCDAEDFLSVLLKCSKTQKYNFCGIFEDAETTISYPVAWTLMTNRLSQLKLLLKFGARNLHSHKIHDHFFKYFYLNFIGSHGTAGNWIFEFEVYNKRSYLVMQVVYLYLLFRMNIYSLLPTQTLVLLWKSFQDPYLTKQELLRPFESKPEWADHLLSYCWQWYHKNVICKDTSMHVQYVEKMWPSMSPRCLKHLARCAVRKNLSANYQVSPYFNLVGEIPQELQKYIQIEL